MGEAAAWGLFAVVVMVVMALDLGVFHRHGKEPTLRGALGLSVFYVALALTFNAWLLVTRGHDAAGEFFAAYVLEKSLSIDNLFVISVIFSSFAIPRQLQHRVLFWGILAALVTRGVAIALGVELLHLFEWMTYVFGAFLLYTAYKLLGPEAPEEDGYENLAVRLAKRFFRFTNQLDGENFFVRRDGRWFATPLFLTLVVVESTDVLFAVDSIPAVLGVSKDPFVIYTSNVFAILGLRALYFVLADAVARFHYMKQGLSAILGFVGVKMILAPFYEVPIEASLAVIVGVLVLTGVASALRQRGVDRHREEWRQARHLEPVAGWGPTDKVTALHRLPTFRGAAIDDLREVVDDLYVIALSPGDEVFAQGDDGDALYVVLTGRVGVYHERDGASALLATLGPDEAFGEVALFDDVPRTATVRAIEASQILALEKDAFHRLGEKRPKVLVEVIRVLSSRLRDANEALATREGSRATPEMPTRIQSRNRP
jgi:tellurite resistance protein TerC